MQTHENTIDDGQMGTASIAAKQSRHSMDMDPEEAKRVGKVYARDASINDVVAAEMKRIQQAFDRKVVDHTEELVQKVAKGEPLNPGSAN